MFGRLQFVSQCGQLLYAPSILTRYHPVEDFEMEKNIATALAPLLLTYYIKVDPNFDKHHNGNVR